MLDLETNLLSSFLTQAPTISTWLEIRSPLRWLERLPPPISGERHFAVRVANALFAALQWILTLALIRIQQRLQYELPHMAWFRYL